MLGLSHFEKKKDNKINAITVINTSHPVFHRPIFLSLNDCVFLRSVRFFTQTWWERGFFSKMRKTNFRSLTNQFPEHRNYSQKVSWWCPHAFLQGLFINSLFFHPSWWQNHITTSSLCRGCGCGRRGRTFSQRYLCKHYKNMHCLICVHMYGELSLAHFQTVLLCAKAWHLLVAPTLHCKIPQL